MSEEKEVLWEPWQFPNISVYKTKLTEDVMDYLWSCIRQAEEDNVDNSNDCLLYTSPSPRDRQKSRMPSSA